jgi:NADH dehydrogenase FAD-containing subunit
MAAKIRLEYPHTEVILVHSRDRLLNAEPLPDEYKAKALELLELTGVKVKLGNRLTGEKIAKSTNGSSIKEVTLSNGETLSCDRVIYTATQTGANTGFMHDKGLDSNGCILVRDT